MAEASLVADPGVGHYLERIRAFPMLEPEEEWALARRWRKAGDRAAADKLISCHLRLVAKLAMRYRGYGLPIGEVISEGSLGLIQAVDRFDPDRGFRLSTYATWWIKAAIQEYVLRSWSLVKLGTTESQRRLFFNLRKAKGRIGSHGDLEPAEVSRLAHAIGVSARDVIDMDRRLQGDIPLNAPAGGRDADRLDSTADETPSQEQVLIERESLERQRRALAASLRVLHERERRILIARRLTERRTPLSDLAAELGVSRERVRQIEATAFEKLQRAVKDRIAAMDGHAKFHNAVGVPIVRIGCREFQCIGDRPPQDHPHIYLDMGEADEIVCPYCSTVFRFDPCLNVRAADPASCAYDTDDPS